MTEREENNSTKMGQKCKFIGHVFCNKSDAGGFSKLINSEYDVTLDQLQYLCGDKDSEKVQIDYCRSNQEVRFRGLKLNSLSVLDPELDEIVKIVKEKFNEELKKKNLISIISSSEIDSSTFYNSGPLILSSNSLEAFQNERIESKYFSKESDCFFEESNSSLMSTEQLNKCCNKYFEKASSEIQEIQEGSIFMHLRTKNTCGRKMKMCKPRKPIILQHHEQYGDNFCVEEQIKPFKLDFVGKSDEIGKWGKNFDLIDEVKTKCKSPLNVQLLENAHCDFRLKFEEEKICFPDKTCTDDFENINRFIDIDYQGFSTLCRKMMTWTNCMTKTFKKNQKCPHVVVHLPSFACPDKFRCRAEKTYQTLQNIQIGRLGWLENKASQVLYICPDDINLDVSVLQKIVNFVRPDVNLDNLWIIKPAKKRRLNEKCKSGCENLFSTPDTYRRVRFLTAGRQAFIVPGILNEMDIFVACELKMPIFGPCLRFQDRLLNKNYAANVLYEANIKQPPFIGFINFSELCANFTKIIFMYPDYKSWLIKINFGHNGHQTAIFKIGQELQKQIKNLLLSQQELENILKEILPNEIQLNKEIYKNFTSFVDDLEQYGGMVQACPNKIYDVISLGILNEHDTAVPVLIATADIIKLKNDLITNVGYIIPQSKASHEDLENLARKVGETFLQEQYIGFFGVDVIIFENQSKVQELWVINVNPYYTDLLSFNDWKMFCSKQCSCCPSAEVDNYAVCSGKLYFSGLSKYVGEQLIIFCKEHNIYYDHKEKSGCVLCPIDYNNKALFIFALHSSRKMAVKKFVDTLKVIMKLSSGKTTDDPNLNVLQLTKELEKNELRNFTN